MPRGTRHYDDQVENEIPGMVYAFAITNEGASDDEDMVISDIKEYALPTNIVEGEKTGGGVCVRALLETLKQQQQQSVGKKNKKKSSSSMMTWADVLEGMQEHIKTETVHKHFLPTLSTSRPIDIRNEPVRIIGGGDGVNRALLIGIHYEEEDNEDVQLTSCHGDLRKVREVLLRDYGFEKQNILLLLDDDGRHHEPTKRLILDSLRRLCEISEPGDSIFVQFSGHGGRFMDDSDKYDEDGIAHALLASCDYGNKKRGGGPIIDDELYSLFVTQIPAGVHVVAVIDPCHPSGGGKSSAIELPYVCEAGDDDVRHAKGFRPGREMIGLVAAAAGATAVASKKKKKKKDNKKKGEKGEKDKKNKKSKKKVNDDSKGTKKKKIEYAEEEDNSDGENDHDDEEYIESDRPKSTKKNEKKKKGLFGLRGDKEEKKKKHNVDDDEGDGSDDESPAGEEPKKQKKKGLFGLRGGGKKK